jgi:sensor histidine kinase YesM
MTWFADDKTIYYLHKMNKFDLRLTETQRVALKVNSDVSDLLNELFQPFSENYNKLRYEIQREFKSGGSPEVTGMTFDRVNFDKNTGKGRFRVLLDINFTFGCEDLLTEKNDQTSEWTFSISKSNNTITFEGSPYIDYRSTADEF